MSSSSKKKEKKTKQSSVARLPETQKAREVENP
jgi:hypothetical protein